MNEIYLSIRRVYFSLKFYRLSAFGHDHRVVRPEINAFTVYHQFSFNVHIFISLRVNRIYF